MVNGKVEEVKKRLMEQLKSGEITVEALIEKVAQQHKMLLELKREVEKLKTEKERKRLFLTYRQIKAVYPIITKFATLGNLFAKRGSIPRTIMGHLLGKYRSKEKREIINAYFEDYKDYLKFTYGELKILGGKSIRDLVVQRVYEILKEKGGQYGIKVEKPEDVFKYKNVLARVFIPLTFSIKGKELKTQLTAEKPHVAVNLAIVIHEDVPIAGKGIEEEE